MLKIIAVDVALLLIIVYGVIQFRKNKNNDRHG